MATRVVSLLLRFALAAVFLYAGVVKIWDFPHRAWATPEFMNDVLNYQLLPWYPSMAVAAFLPWLEIVAGAALLGRRWRLGALTVLSTLTLVFLGAMASAWWRGLDVSCGCFGHETVRDGWGRPFLRDLLLLAAVATGLWLETRETPPGPAR